MSVTLESTARIAALIAAAKNTVGGDAGDLTEAVQALRDTVVGMIDRSIAGDLYNDKITTVRDYAFYECEALTAVDMPNVTEIGAYTFRFCRALTTVNFPLLTSIGDHGFYSTGLTDADFPQVTSLGKNAFMGCKQLTRASLPLVTSIEDSSFMVCVALETADIPLATKIGDQAFMGCTALAVLDLPKVTSIGDYAFAQCSSLKTLILRADTVCTLTGSMWFAQCPIGGSTGYIYVPTSLIEDYKTATKWTSYAARFRALEDYTVDGTTTGALDLSKI